MNRKKQLILSAGQGLNDVTEDSADQLTQDAGLTSC